VYARADRALPLEIAEGALDARDALDALELDALELDPLELDLDREDPLTLDESSTDILYNTMGRHGNLWGNGRRTGNVKSVHY
jgi:hypothetical protein